MLIEFGNLEGGKTKGMSNLRLYPSIRTMPGPQQTLQLKIEIPLNKTLERKKIKAVLLSHHREQKRPGKVGTGGVLVPQTLGFCIGLVGLP